LTESQRHAAVAEGLLSRAVRFNTGSGVDAAGAEDDGDSSQESSSDESSDESEESEDEAADGSNDGAARTTARPMGIGSRTPHAEIPTEAQGVAGRRMPGSLRQLEPELESVLRDEPLPKTNVPRVTDFEDEPESLIEPPGPLMTDELIPQGIQQELRSQDASTEKCISRARRGKSGWRVAKGLRPEPIIRPEAEAVLPAGHGHDWRKRDGEDLWDVIQPTDPPSTPLNADRFAEAAQRLDMTDKQVVSWWRHGFPGAPGMPRGWLVVPPMHVGALKHVEDWIERDGRDTREGFVKSGYKLPPVYPCVCDSTNVVVQDGKARLTIDKRMRHSNSRHTTPHLAFNDFIDLEEERSRVGEFRLPTVSVFCRGVAILLTAGVEVRIGKFDGHAYYRVHGKRATDLAKSGRLTARRYGVDLGVNFGEADGGDHCCRSSDALAYFTKHELRRLDGEYPSKAETVVAWLRHRLGLRDRDGVEESDDFQYAALFYYLIYMDDAAIAAICDLLFDRRGRPVMAYVTGADGVVVSRQRRRDEMYFEAAVGCLEYYGHTAPEDKRSGTPLERMQPRMDFLGIGCDIDQRARVMTAKKKAKYLRALNTMVERGERKGSTIIVPFNKINSNLHKLLHASEAVVLGRAHLFHIRRAVKAAKNGRRRDHKVTLGAKAMREIGWWKHRLLGEEDAKLPLASRSEFPLNESTTLIHYGDASREVGGYSGAGAWTVILGKFVYIVFRWDDEEVRRHSINVLEAVIKDGATYAFFEYATQVGAVFTHSVAFTDNTVAEFVAESSRTQTEALNQLNERRQQWLASEAVSQASERIASEDNDIADMLSRGDAEDALRFALSADLETVRIDVDRRFTQTGHLQPTWPRGGRR
jgi:hypothetical protein